MSLASFSKQFSAFSAWLSVCAVCSCLVWQGCAEKQPDVDPAPFVEAVHEYLDDHSMGLRVAEFKEIGVEGDTAEGIVSLEHEEGMVGVKVRWRFWFEKKSGKWEALRHEQ